MSSTTHLPGLYGSEAALGCGENCRYFIIEGESQLAALRAASAEWETQRDKQHALATRYGASELFIGYREPIGLALPKDKEPLQGVGGAVWRIDKHRTTQVRNCWVPVKGRSRAQQDGYAEATRLMRDARRVKVGERTAQACAIRDEWTHDRPSGLMSIYTPYAFDIDGVYLLVYRYPPDGLSVGPGFREIDAKAFLRMALGAEGGAS